MVGPGWCQRERNLSVGPFDTHIIGDIVSPGLKSFAATVVCLVLEVIDESRAAISEVMATKRVKIRGVPTW